MKLTINTDHLSRHNLSLGEFLILLMGYFDFDYQQGYNRLVEDKVIEPNLFGTSLVVLSNEAKNLVANVIISSDDKIKESGINLDSLAQKLQELYPNGNKPGTTYNWRGKTEDIALKLGILIVVHNFHFTEQEAMDATKEYVASFNSYKHMSLLRNFLFTSHSDEDGYNNVTSQFMTIIENNRKETTNETDN